MVQSLLYLIHPALEFIDHLIRGLSHVKNAIVCRGVHYEDRRDSVGGASVLLCRSNIFNLMQLHVQDESSNVRFYIFAVFFYIRGKCIIG